MIKAAATLARIVDLQSRTIAALLAGREDLARQGAEAIALLERAAIRPHDRGTVDAVLARLRPHARPAPVPPPRSAETAGIFRYVGTPAAAEPPPGLSRPISEAAAGGDRPCPDISPSCAPMPARR